MLIYLKPTKNTPLNSENTAANMTSPVFLILSPTKWILQVIFPRLPALSCTTRSSMIVFMYGSCSLDPSPVPFLGKLLMMSAILESKNKELLLIQTYIRWQALPQWHQCLWAAVSRIMSCQSFNAICTCVSSKEIQLAFLLAEWQC